MQSLVFHGWYEWIAGIFMLVLLSNMSVFDSLISYVKAYLPFIALYEIGYLVNDYYSVKKEDNPRLRMDMNNVQEWEVLSWILIRLLFAFLFAWLTGVGTMIWFFFALAMVLVFAVHNFLKVKELKFLTFIHLALFRFLLPILPFLLLNQLQLVIPVVLVNYVLYRSVNYLDSKNMLRMENRKEAWFKLSFYLLLIPLNIILLVVFENNLPIYFNIFYLVFWLAYFIVSRFRAS